MKLAVVAFPTGRIGSSALMGLLQVAGLGVGQANRLISPAAMNPKGFFELQSQQQLLSEVYRGFYPDAGDPPAFAAANAIGAAHSREYRRLLQTEFGNRFPAAVKSQRCLTLPFLHHLRDDYDIRVLMLERQELEQVHSTLRVWRTVADPLRNNADYRFVHNWISVWRKFAEECFRQYDFPSLAVSFERLIADPQAVMGAVAGFLEIERPPEQSVAGWIDCNLVNRESF
jgi:hypothetical protein